MIEAAKVRFDRRPLLGNLAALLDYLHLTLANRDAEAVMVLCLDSRHRLIKDHLLSEGTIDRCNVSVRQIALLALEYAAAGLIIVHNHPSGDPHPSRQDIVLTREIVLALKPLNIQVNDHLIIARSGHSSFRALGLL